MSLYTFKLEIQRDQSNFFFNLENSDFFLAIAIASLYVIILTFQNMYW